MNFPSFLSQNIFPPHAICLYLLLTHLFPLFCLFRMYSPF
jgi:hypothetical protein